MFEDALPVLDDALPVLEVALPALSLLGDSDDAVAAAFLGSVLVNKEEVILVDSGLFSEPEVDAPSGGMTVTGLKGVVSPGV